MKLIAVIISLLSISYSAPAISATCDDTDVQSVQSKVIASDANSPNITIKFRFVDRSPDPKLPVIIFIPGGPGSPSINGSVNRVPKEFSLVLTDIRGVGCNAYEPSILPDSAINTDNAVEDLVAITARLKGRPFIVYGNSYGTVLATRLAHSLEQKGLRRPQKLVLSGVMAKSFETAAQVETPYFDEFEKAKKLLSSNVLSILSSDKPLGFDGKPWADLIQNMLVQGSVLNGSTAISLFANQFSTLETPQGQEQMKAALAQVSSQKVPADVVRVRSLIGCKEMFPPSTLRLNTFELREGQLTATAEPSICSNKQIEQPYDAADFKIHTPIIYVQGLSDPATPIDQAEHHFASQTKASRLLVALENGGHNPLNTGLTDDCKINFWKAATQSFIEVKEAFTTCGVDAKISEALN